MSGKVRLGVIGLGNIGTAHAAGIYSGGICGMELAAVCDINPTRLEYAESAFAGAARFESYSELLSSGCCDAVIVSVPHRLHAEIAAKALEKGLHVLCEKPEDISVSRAKSLNDAADKSGRVFGIMFNQRMNPLFKRLKELVLNGSLGRIKSSNWIITNWYRTDCYYDSGDWRATWSGEGGGVLLNQAVHNLDIWQWICGMPCEITAFCDTARYHNIETEDAATIFARYPDGSTGVFITSTGEYPGTNRLEISGERGKAVIEGGTLRLWTLETSERQVCHESRESFAKIRTGYTEYTPGEDERETAHMGVIQAFADAILCGAPLVADGREGINELMISNAAYISQWKGNLPIRLPIDPEGFDRLLGEKIAASKLKSCARGTISGDYSERWSVNWQ